MKNRRLLAVLSMILVLCMVLSACGGGAEETKAPETTAEAAETQADTQADTEADTEAATEADTEAADDFSDRVLKGAYSGIADSMDPYLCMNSIACSVCTEQVYVSLLKRDDDHKITTGLCDSYEVSEDALVYTFHVREDATFSNGDPILADDVVFSLEQVVASTTRGYQFDSFGSVEKIDDHNLKVTLSRVDPLFLARIATPSTTSVVSKSFYESCNGNYGTSVDTIVSSGAYVVTEWEYNISMTFEARDDYWGDPSNIKHAIVYSITDTNGLMVAMQTGDIDLSWSPVSGSSYETLKNSDGVHFTEYRGARYENIYMYNKSGIFADLRMRQAVAYAVNREEAVIVGVDGQGFPVRYPGDNPSTNCNPDYESPYMIYQDIEKGKALVEECGNTGLHIVISSYQPDPYPALSTWLQSALNAIGLDAEVQVMERSAWLDACYSEQVVIGILSQVGSTYDMEDDFVNYTASEKAPRGGNKSFYLSDEMDAMINESRKLIDDAERTESYKAMIDLFWKDCPMVPLFCWNYALPTADTIEVPNGRVFGLATYKWVK